MPLIAVAFLASRLVFFLTLFDAHTFGTAMAENIDKRALAFAHGEPMAHFSAWGSYPVFLGSSYKLLNILGLLESRLSILFWLQQALVFLAVLLVFHLAAKVSRACGLIAAAIVACDPLLLYLSGMTISEPAFILALASALWLLGHEEKFESNPYRFGFLLGCSLGLGWVFRSMMIGFIVLFAITSAKKFRVLASATLAMTMILTLFFVAGRSVESQPEHLISRNTGPNIAQTWCRARVMGYMDGSDSFWFLPPAFRRLSNSQSIVSETPFTGVSHYLALAGRCLSEEPARVLSQFLSWKNIFWGPVYPDPLNLAARPWLHAMLAVWGLVLLISSMFAVWRLRPLVRWPALAFFGMLASVYSASPGEERFRLSLLIPMAVMSAVAWVRYPWNPRNLLAGAVWLLTLGLLFAGFSYPEPFTPPAPAARQLEAVAASKGLLAPHVQVKANPCLAPRSAAAKWACLNLNRVKSPPVIYDDEIGDRLNLGIDWKYGFLNDWNEQDHIYWLAGDLLMLIQLHEAGAYSMHVGEDGIRYRIHQLLQWQLRRDEAQSPLSGAFTPAIRLKIDAKLQNLIWQTLEIAERWLSLRASAPGSSEGGRENRG